MAEPSDLAPKMLILPGGRVDPDAVRIHVGQDGEEEGEAEGLCRVSFKLSRDLNKRLDKYLTDRIGFMSRNQLQRLIDVGGVSVNGRPPKCSTRLRLGDEIDVALPPPPSREIQPEAIPIDVLYEDNDLIVINKSPDIIVHPARSHHSGTLLNALMHHFNQQGADQSLSGVGREAARPGVVHRLDRHTSGAMVVAKDDEAHWNLGRQFEQRRVDKRYLALVHGIVEPGIDTIDLPLGPHRSKAKGLREKIIVRHDALGKHAETIYRVRQRFHPVDSSVRSHHGVPTGCTLVELELKTGRTHQIRVHMSHLGYPLVCDDMYAGAPLHTESFGLPAQAAELLNRQALHATTLAFTHPKQGKPMSFTAPLPEDLRSLIGELRRAPGAGPVQTPPGSTIELDDVLPAEGLPPRPNEQSS